MTNTTLTGPQRAALDALAAGASRKQAALAAKRTERTIARWIADDQHFGEALNDIADQAIHDASRRLAVLLGLAVDTLESLLSDEYAPAHVRLRAAGLALDSAVKLTEFADLAERVSKLEERLS